MALVIAQGGIPLSGTVITTDETDVYPTHMANLGMGGIHHVADLTARDAITDERRVEGMFCTVNDTDGQGTSKTYQLVGGITNNDWKEFESGSGGEGEEYTTTTPTTATVGGIEKGSTFPNGISFADFADLLLNPYQAPSFSSLGITGAKSTYEVGEALPADSSFTFAFTNGNNVQADSLRIDDMTDNTILVSNAPITSPCATTHAEIKKTDASSHKFKATATNSKGSTFTKEMTVSWQWAIYSGTSANDTLDDAGVAGLANKKLGTAIAGTYALAAGGYKYVAVPAAFGAPKKWIDTDTGFGVAMDPAVQVIVTNAHGQKCQYNVYRSHFELGGALNLKVE